MNDPAFFGYGSLVNTATHQFADPRPATLQGWRRIWRGTNLRKAAFLSVEPDPDCRLQGLVARVPNADWAALDLRERAYQRHDVSHLIQHDGPRAPTAVYQVQPDHIAKTTNHPILLSYLDVVVQGYRNVFGDAGVAHFFQTTHGWDAPIHDDRASPLYPRHQLLTAQERALVDRHLTAMV